MKEIWYADDADLTDFLRAVWDGALWLAHNDWYSYRGSVTVALEGVLDYIAETDEGSKKDIWLKKQSI